MDYSEENRLLEREFIALAQRVWPVGKHLMELARVASPTSLYFGAQPGNETFFEKAGFKKGVQSFWIAKPRPRKE